MRRFIAIVAVSGMTLTLSSCRGGNTTTPNDITSTAEGATGATRQISVTVDGIHLSGHCVGEAPAGSPTVILESGLAGGQDTLQSIERKLGTRTMVCSYDRAGIGQSDPPPTTPRPLTDMISDLHSLLGAAKIEPPYLLVGQSLVANIVFMYAQAHPEDVVGFVSMNPVPPYTYWIEAAGTVETKSELHDNEIVFYRGENDEQVMLQSTDRMLEDPLPATMSYVVMFAEDCGGDTEFCSRILPPLSAATKGLASVGPRGDFVWVKDSGHEIYRTDLAEVLKTIEGVWSSDT